ncbi:unnamed protein product [Mytilus edulis]|uniref:C-terminal of Roc (COR) domain-containing protein n=1 Tax=Mytilus edulis TaxID=6550 RepID=A0A8S3UGQ3_MYTED|nr:unnamed protein product [Mytilus edulis]
MNDSQINPTAHYDDKEVTKTPLQSKSQTEQKVINPKKTDELPQKQQQRKPNPPPKQTPAVRRQKMPPKYDLKKLQDLQKRPIYTAKSIQDDVVDKIKKKSYMMDIAPSDLVDFGGQKSFDMTHQLFIQHRGTFILLFDGRKGLNTELDEYPQGDITAASILEHWINSVLTYSNKSDDKMPRIVFAATHSDSFTEDEKEKLSLKFKEKLTEMFSSHKLQEHIMYDKVFFINATDADDLNIERLKDTLVDIAFQQSTWGQRMPIIWVPLELQITKLRAEGVKLITKERLMKMNESNNELALSRRRLEDFLLVQHSIGKLLYFDELPLREFVVVQPTAMVNILRAFITDIIFWPKKGPIRNILETLSSTGVLRKKDLLTLWSQPAFKDILTDERTKEYMVHVLLHLDILVEPKRFTEMDKAADLFLVPCIVKEKIPPKMLQNAKDDRTISAIMDADSKNELQIHVKGQRIVAYLINSDSKQLISPDLATTTQECLTLALSRILQFYRRCFGKQDHQATSDLLEIEVGEMCEGETCYIPMSEVRTKTSWNCKHGKTHETKCLLNWIYDKNKQHCEPNCTGLKKETLLLKPNDQHFVQLARIIGIVDFHDFFIQLGMAQSDYDNLNFRYFSNPMDFMLMGLFDWRDSSESSQVMATFEKLLKALTAIEKPHYLCQVPLGNYFIDLDCSLAWLLNFIFHFHNE